ncbi:MAG: hypothetical protein ACW98X_14610, partial [Promethearchaeota archaeon]
MLKSFNLSAFLIKSAVSPTGFKDCRIRLPAPFNVLALLISLALSISCAASPPLSIAFAALIAC